MAEINRDALAKAVAERSDFSLERIEKMYGVACPENREHIWTFLQMSKQQQLSTWQVYVRVSAFFPEAKVENVK